MASLEDLQNQLETALTAADVSAVKEVRESITLYYPEEAGSAESWYKLGLQSLFVTRDFDDAVSKFEAASKCKHPYWSAAARTSWGLCLYRLGKSQKAFFELRKVAYPEEPTAHSITSLAFMEALLVQEGRSDEVVRVRKDRIGQLEVMLKKGLYETPADQCHYLYLLGLAYKDAGQLDSAKRVLLQAESMGPDVCGAFQHRELLMLLESLKSVE